VIDIGVSFSSDGASRDVVQRGPWREDGRIGKNPELGKPSKTDTGLRIPATKPARLLKSLELSPLHRTFCIRRDLPFSQIAGTSRHAGIKGVTPVRRLARPPNPEVSSRIVPSF